MTIILPLSEFKFQFSLSSGPGGQNVNKVHSKATLIWNLNETSYFSPEELTKFREFAKGIINKEGELSLHSQIHSTQKGNREECLKKLSQLLKKFFHKPKKRIKTSISKGVKAQRAQSKKLRSEVKKMRSKII